MTLLLLAQATDASEPSRLEAAGMLLIYLFILVMIFILGTWVFLRASRRYWTRVNDRRPKPTPTDDVWSQHKLPEDEPEEGD